MCRIAICEDRKLTIEEIKTAWAINDDGVGIGWSKEGLNYIKKGFMSIEKFIKFYNKFEGYPHIVHFRRASTGSVNKDLTHPFQVSGTSEIILGGDTIEPLIFHNGTFSDWKVVLFSYAMSIGLKIEPNKWSDSRLIAIMVSRLGDRVLDMLGGKFAILNREGTIEVWGDWIERDGVSFSNLSAVNTHLNSSPSNKKVPGQPWGYKGRDLNEVYTITLDDEEDGRKM